MSGEVKRFKVKGTKSLNSSTNIKINDYYPKILLTALIVKKLDNPVYIAGRNI